ncbi:hypothetical protein ACFX2H_019942 [Malus domestica]
MVWGRLFHLLTRCMQFCVRGWEWLGMAFAMMKDMVSKFSGKFAITEDEQKIVVVDRDEALSLKSSKVFLVGEVDIFTFGFNTKQERTTIQNGGSWLYNKQSLLALEEADDLTHPARVQLSYQDFWVQIKGLPICYMTRQMGKLIGNILGVYVLLDQSKKEFQFGSILRIRVRLDVGKPLRRWVSVQLDGKVVHVDVRYEKLPLTCFLCGKDYRKPQGKKFGLDSEVGWSMKVPDSKDGDEGMREVKVGMENGETDWRIAQPRERDESQIFRVPMDSFGNLGQSLRVIDEHVLMCSILDLNKIAHDDEMIDISMAIIPFVENNDVITGQ